MSFTVLGTAVGPHYEEVTPSTCAAEYQTHTYTKVYSFPIKNSGGATIDFYVDASEQVFLDCGIGSDMGHDNYVGGQLRSYIQAADSGDFLGVLTADGVERGDYNSDNDAGDLTVEAYELNDCHFLYWERDDTGQRWYNWTVTLPLTSVSGAVLHAWFQCTASYSPSR